MALELLQDCDEQPAHEGQKADHQEREQQAHHGFRIETVCADKGYLSKENLELAEKHGAAPFIPAAVARFALHQILKQSANTLNGF